MKEQSFSGSNNHLTVRWHGRQLTFLGIAFVVLILKLLMVAEFDLPSFGGGHDDYWFVLRSLDWYWLTPTYDQMSHIKEPLWPLMIAVLRQTGIPLRLLLELGYASTAFLVSILLIPIGIKFCGVLRLLCFSALVLAPISIPVFERTTSDPLFGMISALTIGLFAYSCRSTELKKIFLIGALSAFLLGLLSITRGEGSLSTASGIGAFIMIVLFQADASRSLRQRLTPALTLGLLMFSVAYAVKLPILVGNYLTFGNWTVSDQSEPSYERAMKALVSVRPKNPVPHAPLARATIERIAAVSPAMREIAPSLLGDLGTGWSRASLGHPTPLGQIGAGWLGWALRDSAAAAGKYATPATARAFYRDLADQVETAFRTKKLSRRLVIHPLAISFPPLEEFFGSLQQIVKASLMPRTFNPVGEWMNPKVQSNYDIAANRKSVFLEKRISEAQAPQSFGVLARMIIGKFKLLQAIWLGVLIFVTVYALTLLRGARWSSLLPFLVGYLFIVGTRLSMMSLIHGYAFHMTDWRYVFPISLSLCMLPFSLVGILDSRHRTP